MGFLGPEDTVFSQLKVERDGRSNVKAQNYATSIEKVRNKDFLETNGKHKNVSELELEAHITVGDTVIKMKLQFHKILSLS